MNDILLLEEVIGYIPYGLKSVSWFQDEPVVGTVGPTAIANYIDRSTNSKLLLRPLDDYQNPITVNGERFIPIDKMAKYHAGHCEYVNLHAPYIDGKPTIQFVPVTKKEIPYEYGFTTWAMMQKMLEWQIDIFQLIERGHALNLNDFVHDGK